MDFLGRELRFYLMVFLGENTLPIMIPTLSNHQIIIVVLAVGKRENSDVYDSLKSRIDCDEEE